MKILVYTPCIILFVTGVIELTIGIIGMINEKKKGK